MTWKKSLCATAAAGLLTGAAQADFNLQVTEIWPGNNPGDNLTEDWFEVTNVGDMAWTAATDGDLYYDDESADVSDAVEMMSISSIAAGESVIYVDGDSTDVTEWVNLWNPVLSALPQVGYHDGSGLSGGGDAVTLFLDANDDQDVTGEIIDSEAYPNADPSGGQSYDVLLGTFSTVGNAAGAVATTTLNDVDQPAIGSPGTIPEPGSLALLGLGGLALIGARRRRA